MEAIQNMHKWIKKKIPQDHQSPLNTVQSVLPDYEVFKLLPVRYDRLSEGKDDALCALLLFFFH